MKNIIQTIIMLAIIISFYACSPEYIPNMVNSPMLSNQGEFQATVATGTSNLDVQTAYAVSDNWALMINGSYADEHSDTTDDFHKHLIVEMGGGYYEKLGKVGRYELFAGYGLGKLEGLYEDALFDEPVTQASFKKIFIQPGIGISTGFYDGSFATRFSFIKMEPDNQMPNINKDYNLFFEPVITNKFGSKTIKFIMQIGFSVPISDSKLYYDYQPFLFSVGLHLNLGRNFDN